MKCKHCRKEFERNGKKLYCSTLCRTRFLSKLYYIRHRKAKLKRSKEWRRNNPHKNRIAVIRSYIRSMSPEEWNEVMEGI